MVLRPCLYTTYVSNNMCGILGALCLPPLSLCVTSSVTVCGIIGSCVIRPLVTVCDVIRHCVGVIIGRCVIRTLVTVCDIIRHCVWHHRTLGDTSIGHCV